ncbi:2-octaprenyl-3-methyl-6-methoxy-1,4-benzoquinol hydroxylase [Psychromonas marina]|uniref:2-octaprenyl-3-methyl-6-methoxy-1,4-benzoquinol hydroxylase n=1 Tax=Psychromonas marina TaxID=88364 RepID=A0ABQ6E4E6_9GAMM|nr:FAD-dependent monooxygenase [Psychromonas marina]GLS92139.1 2-octaprenyl-3-methyl-6-methoxy-1,4-benzoquinol hydroxylase [Psychromonas marina]
MMKNREIIVVGGGMVGALTALLLAKKGFVIHLVEKNPVQLPTDDAPFELRVSAFSAQSKNLLMQAGVWDDLPENRLCAYQGLQTWEVGSSKLKFDSTELGMQALGYIAENCWIQAVLWQALERLNNVYFYENSELLSVNNSDTGVSVLLTDEQLLKGDLLIACDGANSATRRLLDIGITAWDYRQHCMLINIKTDSAQQNITWQEFRETGPCAFLPLAENNASLVWYHSPAKIKQLQSLSNSQLKKQIELEFPTLNFDFEVIDKGSFPLTRRHAQTYHKGCAVLLGDAAHTINPLAGQGVNLGFKDVQCLVDLLLHSSDLPMPTLLKRYELFRKPHNLLMQSAMDLFYKGSKSDVSAVRLLRKTVLLAAQNSGQLKNRVMKYAMGL